MVPRAAQDNIANRGSMYTVFSRKRRAIGSVSIFRSNRPHGLVVELCEDMVFTDSVKPRRRIWSEVLQRISASKIRPANHYSTKPQFQLFWGTRSVATSVGAALLFRVLHVVNLRSLKQVCGVTARRVIAVVADQINRAVAARKTKRKPVCAIVAGLALIAKSSPSVFSPSLSLPLPAIAFRALPRRLVDIAPKLADLFLRESGKVYIDLSHLGLHERLSWSGPRMGWRPVRGPLCILTNFLLWE